MAALATAWGMTGFTLPGMMGEPACGAGRVFHPARRAGPRGQAEIVRTLTSCRPGPRRMPLTSMKTSAFCVAATGPRQVPRPVICPRCSTTPGRRTATGAPSVVPIARYLQVHHAGPLFRTCRSASGRGKKPRRRPTSRGPASSHGVLQLRCGRVHHAGKFLLFLWKAPQARSPFRCKARGPEITGHAEGSRMGVVGQLLKVNLVIGLTLWCVARRPAKASCRARLASTSLTSCWWKCPPRPAGHRQPRAGPVGPPSSIRGPSGWRRTCWSAHPARGSCRAAPA